MLDLMRSYLDFGKWNGGDNLEFGLKDGALDLIFNKSVNLDLIKDYDFLSEIKNKIVGNEIKVPKDEKSYGDFVVNL